MLRVVWFEFDLNFEYGLWLLVGFMGMFFILFKDEDFINFNDLNNDWFFVFRRGKVLKGGKNLVFLLKKV